MKKLNRCFVPHQADLKCSGPGEDNGIGPESCSLAPRLEYNNAESSWYIFLFGKLLMCVNANYQESESLIKGLRASNHSSSPLQQIMFCLVTLMPSCFQKSAENWFVQVCWWDIMFLRGMQNAENIVLEVVCAQTGGKNPKACAEKFLFIQTIRLPFKLRQVYPTYWKTTC